MKQCFGYVRVSTLKQGEGVSLDAQKDAIIRYCESNHIEITRWFEEAQTAAKSGRPIFMDMLKRLRRGRASGVVMHKIDRSARNFRDWAQIGELQDAGIDVHFATESLNFKTRGGRLSADIQAVIAADYIRNLREEIHKGQHGQMARGLYPFSAPIGYLNNGKGKMKTLDPERSPFIKKAFELYASGEFSTRSLRAHLTELGLRNQTGRPISKGCLEKFLANPFYAGVIRIRTTGAVYDGKHEALISPALFETVQEVRAGKSGKKITKHNHLMRGLFACADCCNSMIPEKQKAYVYYRCHTLTCRGNCVRQEVLERSVIGALQRSKLTDQDIAQVCRRIDELQKSLSSNPELETYPMRLQVIEQKLDKLDDAAIDQIIDKATHARRRAKLLLDRKQLEEKKAKSEQTVVQHELVRKFLERAKNLAASYNSGTAVVKREIIKLATSNRSVSMKNPMVEPANWLVATRNLLSGFSCAESRTTNRRPHRLHKQQVDQLVRSAVAFAAAEKKLKQDTKRAFGKNPSPVSFDTLDVWKAMN